MARAELNEGREAWEVGQAIVAAWFRVLNRPGRAEDHVIKDTDLPELKRVFEEIFKTKIAKVIADPAEKDGGIIILVPQPPKSTPQELLEYLKDFHDQSSSTHFHEELGRVVLFGCGK